jgi:cytochrome oxidase assembly protein ShyY1
MVGVMRWPEPRGMFSPKDEPARNLWFVRDPVGIASAKGWGDVAPFFVELESPQPPGGLPRAGALKVNLRNEHLQYAITWYGLALVVAVMFAVWLYGRRQAHCSA